MVPRPGKEKGRPYSNARGSMMPATASFSAQTSTMGSGARPTSRSGRWRRCRGAPPPRTARSSSGGLRRPETRVDEGRARRPARLRANAVSFALTFVKTVDRPSAAAAAAPDQRPPSASPARTSTGHCSGCRGRSVGGSTSRTRPGTASEPSASSGGVPARFSGRAGRCGRRR